MRAAAAQLHSGFTSPPRCSQKMGTPHDAISRPSWWSTLFAASGAAQDSAEDNGAPAVPAPSSAGAAAVVQRPRASSARSSPTARDGGGSAGFWQSKPAPAPTAAALPDKPPLARTSANGGRSTSASGRAAIGKPPLPPTPPEYTAVPSSAPTTASMLADGIAAGLQEGLSWTSQLTGYFGGSKRRSPHGMSPAGSTTDLIDPDFQLGRLSRSRTRQRGASPPVSESDWETVQPPDDGRGLWQIMWKEGDMLRTLPFRTTADTRAHIQAMVRPLRLCVHAASKLASDCTSTTQCLYQLMMRTAAMTLVGLAPCSWRGVLDRDALQPL